MCHVACGKLDCYYEDGYGGPWDVAAGLVIVKEARVKHLLIRYLPFCAAQPACETQRSSDAFPCWQPWRPLSRTRFRVVISSSTLAPQRACKITFKALGCFAALLPWKTH